MQNQIHLNKLEAFALAGKSSFSIKSNSSGIVYHFKISRKQLKANFNRFSKEDQSSPWIWFVYCSENLRDWRFMITLNQAMNPAISKKSEVLESETIFKAFCYVWNNRNSEKEKVERVDSEVLIWHDGICSRCGRALTDEISVSLGIGPKCRGDK
jgi:hypothetical protein